LASGETGAAVAFASTVILAPALALAYLPPIIKSRISEAKAKATERLEEVERWFKREKLFFERFSRRLIRKFKYRKDWGGDCSTDWFDFIVKSESLTTSRSKLDYYDSSLRLHTMFNVTLKLLKEQIGNETDPLNILQMIHDYLKDKYAYRRNRALLTDDLVEKYCVTKIFNKNPKAWKIFFSNPGDEFLSFAPDAPALIESACKKGTISKKQGDKLLTLRDRALSYNRANCEFKAKLALGLAQRLMNLEGSGWQLGLMRYRKHIVTVLYNEETNEVYDPENSATLAGDCYPIFYPQMFIEAYLRGQEKFTPLLSGKELLMNKYNSPQQKWGDFDEFDLNRTNSIFDFSVDIPLPDHHGGGGAAAVRPIPFPARHIEPDSTILEKLSGVSHGIMAELRHLRRRGWFSKWVFIGVALAFVAGRAIYKAYKEMGVFQTACELSSGRPDQPYAFFRHPKTGDWDITKCPPSLRYAIFTRRQSRLENIQKRLEQSIKAHEPLLKDTLASLKGGHYLDEKDFDRPESIQSLYDAVEKDLYKKSIGPDKSTPLEKLNKILDDPQFPSLWDKKFGKKLKPADWMLSMANNISRHLRDDYHKKYHRDRCSEFIYSILNRALLELAYPELCPAYPRFYPEAFAASKTLNSVMAEPSAYFDAQLKYRRLENPVPVYAPISNHELIGDIFSSLQGAKKLATLSDQQLETFFRSLPRDERRFFYIALEALARERWEGKPAGSPDSSRREGRDNSNIEGNNGKSRRDQDGLLKTPSSMPGAIDAAEIIYGEDGRSGQRAVAGYRKDISYGKNGAKGPLFEPSRTSGTSSSSKEREELQPRRAGKVLTEEGNEKPPEVLMFDLVDQEEKPAAKPVELPYRPAEEVAGNFAPQQEEKSRTLTAPHKREVDWFADLLVRIIDQADNSFAEEDRSLTEGLKMRLLALPEARSILGDRYQKWVALLGEPDPAVACRFDLPRSVPLNRFHVNYCQEKNIYSFQRGRFLSFQVTPAFINELLKLSTGEQKEVMRRMTDRAIVVLHFYSRQLSPDSPKRESLDKLVQEWLPSETRILAADREEAFEREIDHRYLRFPKTDFSLFGTEGEQLWSSLKRQKVISEFFAAGPFNEKEDVVLNSVRLNPEQKRLVKRGINYYLGTFTKEGLIDALDDNRSLLKNKKARPQDVADAKKFIPAIKFTLSVWDELVNKGYLIEFGAIEDRDSLSKLSPEKRKIFSRIFKKAEHHEWGEKTLEAIEDYDVKWDQLFSDQNFSAKDAIIFGGLSNFNKSIFSFLENRNYVRWEDKLEHPISSLERTNEYLRIPALYDFWVANDRRLLKAPAKEDARILTLAFLTRADRSKDFDSLPNQKKLMIMELNRLLLGLLAKAQ